MFVTRLDLRDVHINELIADLSGMSIVPVLERTAAAELVPKFKDKLVENKSVWKGTLKNSIRAKIDVTETITGAASISVGTHGVMYGLNVEEGSRPHQPDVTKLERWASEKLHARNPSSVARNIASSIARKGIKAKPFMRPVWDRYEARFTDELVKHLRQFLRTA